MTRRICLLMSCICLVMLHPLQGETSSFRFQGITEDLPSLSVSSIAKDSRGFMWFGTQAGLAMYDGHDYITHTSVPFAENTLSSNLVQTIFMDKDDILWVGTYAGLDRYDIRTGTFTNYSVGSNVVVSVLRDSKGRLWAGTLDGLGCMQPGSDFFHIYRKEKADRFIGNNTVRNLYEDSSGRIYACTYDGLWEYDPGTDSFVPSHLLVPGNPAEKGVVYDIRQDDSGDFWIARWGVGFIRIHPENSEYRVYPLQDNRIYCMNTTFNENVVLAGTWGGGLNVLDKKTGAVTTHTQRSPAGQRLTNDIVYSLYDDDTRLLWLGTNGGGLNVHDPAHSWFSSLDAELDGTGLPTGKNTGICVDGQGDIWIGVTNKGLTRYSPKTGAFRHYRADPAVPGSLPSDSVQCLFKDSRGTVYIGLDIGICVYDPSRDSFMTPKWSETLEKLDGTLLIPSIAETSDGSLWFGTMNSGVIRYFPEYGKYTCYRNNPLDTKSLSDNMVYFVREDKTGMVWIGTNRGLNRMDPATGESTVFLYNRENLDGISSNTVYSCYPHDDGTIWFGTRNGGVCVWHPETGKFTHITTADGLPSDTVVGILPSTGRYLWFASQNGLVRYGIDRKSIFVYRTSDGLLSQQFNTAYCIAGDDRRFFGTPIGIVWFSENSVVTKNTQVPGVAISVIMINNQFIPLPFAQDSSMTVTLRSDQRNIDIAYTPLDFSPLARYTCSYMLDGFDKEWIEGGERDYATYTNLNPGTYRFKVSVNRSQYQVGPKDTTVVFIIPKPLFLRWYAIVLYLVILFAAVYLVVKLRKSQVLERKVGELEATANNLLSVNTHLEQLSYHDPLTGIPNRRYFEYVIAKEWDAALVCSDPLSVLMVDIDFFKVFNDTYGHMEGDKALRSVANALNIALFRVSDVIARYGGEEFVIVLPGTNEENARLVCDRLMTAVDECHIPFNSGISDHLSVSIGCYTAIPTEFLTFENYMQRADQALYRAKNDGRNRYSIYTKANFEV